MAITRGERLPLARFRWMLTALVVVTIVSGLFLTQRQIPRAAAAPNPFLNVIGSGPELQNVTVVNLYWDQNWDGDQPTSTLSKTVIDYLTRSIIGSSYFGDAAQYNAGPVTWGGGFLADSRCGATPNVDHIATYFDVGNFVQCERDTHSLPSAIAGGTVLYNVLLPPGFTANFAQNLGPITLDIGNCSGGGWSAYHYKFPPPPLSTDVYFTVIPTSAECRSNSLDAVSQSLSHEMVEAITDPGPPFHGWRHFFSCIWTPLGSICGLNPADWPQSLQQGEAADLCAEPSGVFATPPVGFSFAAPVAPYAFTSVHVAPYFSNQRGGCFPTSSLSFSVLPAPTVTGVSPTSGLPTGGTSVTITGSGFLGETAVTFTDGANAPVPALNVHVISDTIIQSITPAGRDGATVSVRVTNLAGTSPDSQANRFLYSFPCSVALQVQPASPQPLGTMPALSATASHCPPAEFQFSMTDPVGEVWVLQPWSTSTSLHWPFVLDVLGQYTFSVQVRATGQAAVLASNSSSYTLTNPCPSVQLTLTPAQPAIGTPVNVSATAPNCPRPEFRFTESDPSGALTVLQEWSASASPSHPFTPRDAGRYSVAVSVRAAGVTADPLAQASTTFTLLVTDAPAPTGLHATSATRTSVSVGWNSPALSTITAFRATLQVDPDPTSWHTVELHPNDPGFSSHSATFGGLTPGTSYTVVVAACDAAGSCSWSAPLAVSTLAGPPPPPCKPGRCF